ncbi:MAG: thioredoxin family protein [Promethearchaeota archaeon]
MARTMKRQREGVEKEAPLERLTRGVVHLGSCLHFTKIFNALSDRIPLLVYVWAEWCAPCRQYGPLFEKVAEKYRGKAIFLKISSAQCPDFSEQWRVMGVPTVLAFQRWRLVDRLVGAQPGWKLEKFVQKATKYQ